jgi:DNA-binding LacI/PurR family transcriptional regulator
MAIKHGCRRIGVITGPASRLVSKDLLEAAEDCLTSHPGRIEEVVHVTDGEENGLRAMGSLFKSKPDCILVTEPAFPGVWEYLAANSLRCPDDVFVIRHGKEKQGSWYPNRASINLESDSVKHGQIALQMLLKNSKDTVKVDSAIVIPNPA